MVRRQQAADRVVRAAVKLPGHPKFQREIKSAFWSEITKGLLADGAAGVVGVSPAVGARWFRHRGGMPRFDPRPSTGRYRSFREGEEIALLEAQGTGVRTDCPGDRP